MIEPHQPKRCLRAGHSAHTLSTHVRLQKPYKCAQDTRHMHTSAPSQGSPPPPPPSPVRTQTTAEAMALAEAVRGLAKQGVRVLAWGLVCTLKWRQAHPAYAAYAPSFLIRFLKTMPQLTQSAVQDIAMSTTRLLAMRSGERMLDLFAGNPFWTTDLDGAEELESSELFQRVAGRLAACGVTSIWKIRSAKWLQTQPHPGHESEFDLRTSQLVTTSNGEQTGQAQLSASLEHSCEPGKTPTPGEANAASKGSESQVNPKIRFKIPHNRTANTPPPLFAPDQRPFLRRPGSRNHRGRRGIGPEYKPHQCQQRQARKSCCTRTGIKPWR